MLIRKIKSPESSPPSGETDLDRFLWSREILLELSEQLAQQAEAILTQHNSYIDTQIREHTIATAPNGENATVSVMTEHMRRTRAIAYGNKFVQLRDFFNESTGEAEPPKHIGAILLVGTTVGDRGHIEDGKVFARFQKGKTTLEFTGGPEAVELLENILNEIKNQLKKVVGFPTEGGARSHFKKMVTNQDHLGSTGIEEAQRLYAVLRKGYSLDELEKPFRKV